MAEPFIKRIKVRNFKSFADLDLDLQNFNVVIGANASGKSNFVEIFRFLRDARRHGLDNAVSMQGGSKHAQNLRLAGKNTVIELEAGLSKGARMPVPRQNLYVVGGKWRLEFKADGGQIELVEDSWTFYVSDRAEQGMDAFAGDAAERQDSRGRLAGRVNVTRGDGVLRFDVGFDAALKDALRNYAIEPHARRNELLVESRILEHLFPRIFCFERIGAYDFDSGLARGAAPHKGAPVLEDDGSNLAAVLKNVLSRDADREVLRALVADMLPYVESIHVKDSVKSAVLTSVEEHLEETPLPSFLLSDGTVAVMALIVSLYLEATQLVIIEEPERHMHPYLIPKAVGMMKEASQERQIIITTHSPELVRYAGVDSLYAIKRGSAGFSEIGRPSTNAEIAGFLEHDLDIGEMHVQRMLEW